MKIEFAFLCEGSSDEALKSHLEHLCVEVGFEEAHGIIPQFDRLPDPIGKSIEARMQVLQRLFPTINIVFIHRDSDSRDPSGRYREIESGMNSVGGYQWVGVVPVQELEAWILVDEEGIRYVAENPNGTTDIRLPQALRVESIANPKQALWEAIECASELSGRKLEKLKKSRSKKRRMLIERITHSRKIREIPSWVRLYNDIEELHQLLSREQNC